MPTQENERVKTAIISADEEMFNHLDFHLSPLGFQIVHYNDPVQAMEILSAEYALVILDASHFPRHWKPFVKLIRETRNKEQTVIILIKSSDFAFEEAAKAIFLNVNGIIDYDPKDKQEVFRLTEIFKRYRSLQDSRRFLRVIPDKNEEFAIIFTNHRKHTIVTGIIRDISIQGMMFRPLLGEMMQGLQKGDLLRRCSLQIGTNLISLDCRISRLGREVGLEFTYFNDDAHHRLFTYLMERPDRKLHQEITRADSR
ncbi:MAG: hypothetical protein EHM28_10880 [Spirochaetaceae bacterium]|nr:MAG: hypothetical protein EHM28_10880 [Spirochaetaceae bacterium]